MECLTVIRDGHGAVLIRTRNFNAVTRRRFSHLFLSIQTFSGSPYTGGPRTLDHENTVKAYSALSSMLGRGHSLVESHLGRQVAMEVHPHTSVPTPSSLERPMKPPLSGYFTQTSLCFTKPATVSLLYTQTQYLANRWGTPTRASQQIVYLLHENQEIQKIYIYKKGMTSLKGTNRVSTSNVLRFDGVTSHVTSC